MVETMWLIDVEECFLAPQGLANVAYLNCCIVW